MKAVRTHVFDRVDMWHIVEIVQIIPMFYNNFKGQYSYIGDDGKTYTVKYEAGVNGFRILEGDHIPSGGQTAGKYT